MAFPSRCMSAGVPGVRREPEDESELSAVETLDTDRLDDLVALRYLVGWRSRLRAEPDADRRALDVHHPLFARRPRATGGESPVYLR
jgi:hypothetical protein